MSNKIKTMKYNFFTWWLDITPKTKIYKVWKIIIVSVLFIMWTLFVAVYRDYYWQFSLKIVLPVAVVDIGWDMIAFAIYCKKGKNVKQAKELILPEKDEVVEIEDLNKKEEVADIGNLTENKVQSNNNSTENKEKSSNNAVKNKVKNNNNAVKNKGKNNQTKKKK